LSSTLFVTTPVGDRQSPLASASERGARTLDHPRRGERSEAETGVPRSSLSPCEEVLVRDARAGLTPAQVVEGKLAALLQNTPLPVSYLQATGWRRRG
jgi:hypothetical protein